MIVAGNRRPALRIVEVGPRDGLQNEPSALLSDEKIKLIERLADAGLPEIEATSFVRPEAIPNLADADRVSRDFVRRPTVHYTALVPNARGLERALQAGYDSIAFFMSASEAHNRANVNRTVEESLENGRALAQACERRTETTRLRAYLSTSFGCPYSGPVGPERVAQLAAELVGMGFGEVSLGDTIGVATPATIASVLGAVSERVTLDHIALHLHDTRGTALANALEGFRAGVRIFDGSVGGLGGCPYAPGAAGNVATEDLVYMFEGMGIDTGVDLDELVDTARWLGKRLGHDLPGHLARAGARWWPSEMGGAS